MKALVLTEVGKLSYEEHPMPECGRKEVLVAVKACGICGSDVHGMDGSTGRRRPPIIMGHEAAGVIAQAGSAVEKWKSGDRVTFDSTIYCGGCAFCLRGEVNLCDRRRVLGVSCEEYRQQGAFAEYVAVPEHILYELPDALPFEHAAMVEPFSIALHAARRSPAGSGGGTVAVVGCGTIGLALVQVARVYGFRRIFAIDIAPEKLELALKIGATDVINSATTDAAVEMSRLSDQSGVDRVFEAVGIDATVNLALRCVRRGGSVTLVGNLAPMVQLPLQLVVTRELTLNGACASAGEYSDCLEMMSRGAIDPVPLLSAIAPMEEGVSWFDRLYRKEAGLMKVVLKPG